MKATLSHVLPAACLAIGCLGAAPVHAAVALVTFDPPATAQGPSIFVAVPGPQTIVTAPATFSGGVVLGFATFFPAISFATVPNVYGTADFGNGLATSLNIAITPGFTTTEVSFALFNGETFNQTYQVDAFDGANLVASQTLTNIAPNFNSGYGLIDLIAPNITSVAIAPTSRPSTFDFLIDTVTFNQSITNVINIPPPPVDPLPPVDPVQGHRHGHGEGEVELVEVDFGDDINDIRGSVLVVPPAPVPLPAPLALLLSGVGVIGGLARRRAGSLRG